MTNKPLFALEDILPVLPHRPPFLFVDRVMMFEPHKSIVAERRLRAEEPHFSGHFPGRPIMPGVLITEALAQTSGLLIGLSEMSTAGAPPETPKAFFLAVTNIKFTHPARPGDVLVLRAASDRQFAALRRFNVEAIAGRNLIASGSLTLAMVGGNP
jgi:3-hydroxymyristoyl/3-hydroxydecanoyl-(acyl carrier protein) dehydratase